MEITAKTRYVRMSARKVRLIAGVIRGMDVGRALDQLSIAVKAARLPIEKTVKSAIANAEHNFQLKEDQLRIKEIRIDQGPSLKRWRARAFGRAATILKHSCHITVILGEKEVAVVTDTVPAKKVEKKVRTKKTSTETPSKSVGESNS